jgi:outer membrane immunogenic protein
MKRITISLLALAVAAGSAAAADLPSRKAPPPAFVPPPPPMWTGFYAGLNAGYGFGTGTNATTIGNAYDQFYTSYFNQPGWPPLLVAGYGGLMMANSGTASLSPNGFIGGGQIGYNWQFYNNFVVGVEADIQGVAASGGNANAVGIGFVPADDRGVTIANASRRLDYLGTVRGRLGWLFTPTLLLYGTGGLAYGGVNVATNLMSVEQLGAAFVDRDGLGFGGAAFSDTRVGWTAGGGLEWMFWPNWSAKVEYLYYDLGSVALPTTPVIGIGPGGALDWSYAATSRTRFDGHIVRAGVNYHFNWGAAPVMAKY